MSIITISDAGGNFNGNGTWVGGVVPVAGDAVVATATSGQLTVDIASGGVGLLSVDFTNYANTLTMNNTLTVSGNVTLASGMTVVGTSNLIVNNTATLTSNNVTWSGGLQLIGIATTYTLGDNWTINGTFAYGNNNSTTCNLNGNTLTVGGGLSVTTSATGTANLILNGTGTWSSVGGNGTLFLNTEINTTGTITLSGTNNFRIGTLKYTSGTVVSVGSALNFTNNSTFTINNSGLTLNNIGYVGNLIINGTNGFNISGMLTRNASGNLTLQAGNTYTINSTGGLTSIGTSGSHVSMVSSSGSVKAIFTLTAGATQNVTYTNATRIDSSGGVPIFSKGAVLTNTLNWRPARDFFMN